MTWFAKLLGLLPFLAGACAADVVSIGYDEPVKNQGLMPVGPVWSCYGSGCPYGECDNDETFSDVDCDDVYPGPVDDGALFCQPGEVDDYCLVLGMDEFNTDYWVIRCGGGTATAEQCALGCGAGSFDSARCN